MKEFTLGKAHKLCSRAAVERLFGSDESKSMIAYPLRALWLRREPESEDVPWLHARFMITVPKKRLRHAVGRVAMRRRIREAYRLNRKAFEDVSQASECAKFDIAFIYVADGLKSYASVERAMKKLLSSIYGGTVQKSDNVVE